MIDNNIGIVLPHIDSTGQNISLTQLVLLNRNAIDTEFILDLFKNNTDNFEISLTQQNYFIITCKTFIYDSVTIRNLRKTLLRIFNEIFVFQDQKKFSY